MAIYFPPSLEAYPRRAVFSTWTDHWPFGYDLITELAPKIFVELGTYSGFSYFAFCQAVRDRSLGTECYAVDTWEGDQHTGGYESEIYKDVARFNTAHAGSWSHLLPMRFEEALEQFEDESIGLLHIDGFHTFEAVSGDYRSWLPKVRPGGVILFHDIAARMLNFGAWRFWQEVSKTQPSFEFHHGYGLGVLQKAGGGPVPDRPLLRALFDSDAQTKERLRAFYVHASLFHERARVGDKSRAGKAHLPTPGGSET